MPPLPADLLVLGRVVRVASTSARRIDWDWKELALDLAEP
jgi:hypothetical protein